VKRHVERLFTHRWRLEQAEEAYRLFDTQTTARPSSCRPDVRSGQFFRPMADGDEVTE
jgi:hypothetical protein